MLLQQQQQQPQQQLYLHQQQQRAEQMRQRGVSPGHLPTLQRAPAKRTTTSTGKQISQSGGHVLAAICWNSLIILIVFAGLTPPPVQRAPSPGQMRGLSSPQTQAMSGATFYPPPYQAQHTGFSPPVSRGQGQAPMGPNFSYSPGAHPPYYPQHPAQPMQMPPQSSMMPQAPMQAPLYPMQRMMPGPGAPNATYTGPEAMMMHQQVGTHK